MQTTLFVSPNSSNTMLPAAAVDKGAAFSDCRKYRYTLWRIWQKELPFVMFIGLNPSTANEDENDATIRSVERLSKTNGYGGFYMMNCFPFVSTDPKDLVAIADSAEQHMNNTWLMEIKLKCSDVVFAWGSFDVVKELGRDVELSEMFPQAKALIKNKNGSPRHPLYVPSTVKLVEW